MTIKDCINIPHLDTPSCVHRHPLALQPSQHSGCVYVLGGPGHYRIADLLTALDATANADVKHRADAYADATRAQDDAREWKARAEKAEAGQRDLLEGNVRLSRDLARVSAELNRTRETYESELAEAERCERDALEKAVALAAERDRLLATIDRINDVRRDFYEVRGDWADPEGAAALKAQMERAILGAPPFELPTQVPARIVAVKRSTGSETELTLFTDGDTTWWADIEDWGPFWTRSQVMEQFTDHRLLGADQ